MVQVAWGSTKMKVLYVGSNPENERDLRLEIEITLLQTRLANVGSNEVDFIFLPHITIEQFPIEISRHKPDILHITAHAGDGNLAFSSSDRTSVPLSGDQLAKLLDYDSPPKIVYLNGCNSADIAKQLVPLIPMAIGTTAPITTKVAQAAVTVFYDRLFQGATVNSAFEAGKALIEAMQLNQVSSVLYAANSGLLTKPIYQPPKIIARFADGDCSPGKDGFFYIQYGIAGCPQNTIQVVFFTDDESFIEGDDEDEYASSLCTIARTAPVRGILWAEEKINIYGNYRIYASVVTAGGEIFAVSSYLCIAIKDYFKFGNPDAVNIVIPPIVGKALEQLMRNDDADDPEYLKKLTDNKVKFKRKSGKEIRMRIAKRDIGIIKKRRESPGQ